MRVRILPYKMGSQSASRLAEGLREAGVRCMKVYPDRAYRPRPDDVIINWGSSQPPRWSSLMHDFPLNPFHNTCGASNKLAAFNSMEEGEVSIPEFTTRWGQADDWMQQDRHTIVVRHKLIGHSGEGIEIVSHTEGVMDLPEAPLYVKYIKKSAEYRVHVFKGQVIDIQQKRKKRGVENDEVDYKVRSYANGWVFCRDDINPHASVSTEAINAVDSLGLDFGAVDVIWNNHHRKAYVLEVNTAPGLEGATVGKYVGAVVNFLRER